MSDSYQPIYDATRSRIGNCSPNDIIRDTVSGWDVSFAVGQIRDAFQEAASALVDPAALYRPAIGIDGNKWCALYGENLQDGVAGFGDSPHEAMVDFNRSWYAKLPTKPDPQA